MQIINFKIENTTEDHQQVELMRLENNSSVDLSYSITDVDYFKGITFKSIDNTICQKLFEGGRIFISGIPVYLTEWINIDKPNDGINISLLLNNVDSICFKLNPKCKVEIKMTLNDELKKQLSSGK